MQINFQVDPSENIRRNYKNLHNTVEIISNLVFLNHAVNDEDDTVTSISPKAHPVNCAIYPRKLLPKILLTVFTITNKGVFHKYKRSRNDFT